MRWVLEEAAHKAKTRPPFVGFYAQCAARRGKHIATVAVARKLLARSLAHPQGGHASREGHLAGCARDIACACNTAESAD